MQATAKEAGQARLGSLEELEQLRGELRAAVDPDHTLIVVCHGTGCVANGSPGVTQALKKALAEAGEDIKVIPGIKTTGCHGFCSPWAPWSSSNRPIFFYQQVKPSDIEDIVAQDHPKGRDRGAPALQAPQTGEALKHHRGDSLLRRSAAGGAPEHRPDRPHRHRGRPRAGAYAGAAKALTEMRPGEVIEAVTKSGLRGRGGAGFPTGIKWSLAAKHGDVAKYVLCNADEGDPGPSWTAR